VLSKTIGSVPIRAFTIDHADRAMRALPEGLTSATRRQYAQALSKVLRLAAYPLRLIPASPLPPGWLPKVKSNLAKSYLYPAEDARLMASAVPFERRLLWGFLAREGMRLGEALALQWRDLDLARGAVRIDENKTDDPRAWALDAGVVRALAKVRGGAPDSALVFQLERRSQAAETFRKDLMAAGIDRAELFEESPRRMPIRVHDLRGTFVTLALASGKTETWVADRTGHKSSIMINRYRRAARSAGELGLGWLEPLDRALGLESGPRGGPGSGDDGDRGDENSNDSEVVAPPGLEPGIPKETDFKSAAYANFAKGPRCAGSARRRIASPAAAEKTNLVPVVPCDSGGT
jgi:integrase